MDWFDPNTWKLPAELIDYWKTILVGVAGIGGIILGIIRSGYSASFDLALSHYTGCACAFKVRLRVLLEAKASGISVAQELRNRYGIRDWVVCESPVRGDKVARALSVQANFSNGMIYAPDRDWAELVIRVESVRSSYLPLGNTSNVAAHGRGRELTRRR